MAVTIKCYYSTITILNYLINRLSDHSQNSKPAECQQANIELH